MTPTRSSRPRNPRVVALMTLRQMKRFLADMCADWNQSQTLYEGVTQAWRKRRDDEKIESNPAAWRELVRYMRAVESLAAQTREHAEAQLAKLEADQHS